MNVLERERILTDATRRYLLGKISYDMMAAIRDKVRDEQRRARVPAPR